MQEKQALPDLIDYDLKVVFIGFNPGLRSAEVGHHYAGRSNRFWKFLYEAGLIPEPLKAEEDWKLLRYRFGSLNIVDRPSRGADELTKAEFAAGREVLYAKLAEYRPWIACYMGVGVYREFAKVRNVRQGLQTGQIVPGVLDYVISSPSGLNRLPVAEQLLLYRGLQMLIQKLEKARLPS